MQGLKDQFGFKDKLVVFLLQSNKHDKSDKIAFKDGKYMLISFQKRFHIYSSFHELQCQNISRRVASRIKV